MLALEVRRNLFTTPPPHQAEYILWDLWERFLGPVDGPGRAVRHDRLQLLLEELLDVIILLFGSKSSKSSHHIIPARKWQLSVSKTIIV